MTMNRILSTSVLTLAVLAAAACSGSDDAADTPPATEPPSAVTDAAPADGPANAPAVGISSSRFDPTEIAVAVGETVTFTNNDPFAHTVTARDDAAFQFDSGNLGQDETFDVEFAEAGTYDYFCQIHPTMRATVVVG